MNKDMLKHARYWLIWCKSIADQSPTTAWNGGLAPAPPEDKTYHAQGYRQACNDIAKVLASKLDELEEGAR